MVGSVVIHAAAFTAAVAMFVGKVVRGKLTPRVQLQLAFPDSSEKAGKQVVAFIVVDDKRSKGSRKGTVQQLQELQQERTVLLASINNLVEGSAVQKQKLAEASVTIKQLQHTVSQLTHELNLARGVLPTSGGELQAFKSSVPTSRTNSERSFNTNGSVRNLRGFWTSFSRRSQSLVVREPVQEDGPSPPPAATPEQGEQLMSLMESFQGGSRGASRVNSRRVTAEQGIVA